MDKIVELLGKLDNKVPTTIAKRLDGLKNLESRYNLAKKELAESPDDEELKEAMTEITDYLEDYRDDLIEDLEDLVEAKEKANEQSKADNKPNGNNKPSGEEKPNGDEKPDDKKSSNIAGFVLGGVLLVASLGAINYFRNNR
jgi:hypothetical protein